MGGLGGGGGDCTYPMQSVGQVIKSIWTFSFRSLQKATSGRNVGSKHECAVHYSTSYFSQVAAGCLIYLFLLGGDSTIVRSDFLQRMTHLGWCSGFAVILQFLGDDFQLLFPRLCLRQLLSIFYILLKEGQSFAS